MKGRKMRTAYLVVLVALMTLAGCGGGNDGFKEHPSGLQYRFFEMNPEGDTPEVGDIMVISFKMTTINGDLVDESAFYRLQLSNPVYQGDFHTGLAIMQVDDSVCFKLDAFDFYEKSRKRDLPPQFQQGDPVLVYVKLKNILNIDDLETERLAYYHSDRDMEMELLEDYLELTNTTVAPTESGLYFIEKKTGTGKKAVAGSRISAHYTGKTIDGKGFDSSLNRGNPLVFVLGQGQVIKGWDEGFALMSEGGEARLIIPSDLAYGKEGFKDVILPYSTLVFDVQLIRVD